MPRCTSDRRRLGFFGQVERAIEQQVLAVGDGGGQRHGAQVGGQHGFHASRPPPAPPGWRAAPRPARSRRRAPRPHIRPASARADRRQHLALVLVLAPAPGSSVRRAPRRREPSCAAGSAAPELLQRPWRAGNRSPARRRAPRCRAAPASRRGCAAKPGRARSEWRGHSLRRAQIRLADAGRPAPRPAAARKRRRAAAPAARQRPRPAPPRGEISTAAGGRPPVWEPVWPCSESNLTSAMPR